MRYRLLIGLILAAVFAAPVFAGHDILVTSTAVDAQEGPDAQILRAVAHRLNLEIFFQNAPFKRRLIMMENGDLDLICGLLKRPDREAYIRYIQPAYKTRSDTVFFVSKKRYVTIRSYADLRRLKIGTVIGANYFPRFDNDATLNKDPVHQHSINFRKLALGRIDTLIANEAAGIDFMHKLKISDRLVMADYRFNREKRVYFGLSKKSRFMADITALESVIREMVDSGKIRQIISNYYIRRGLPVPFF
ncbi:MAG: ABC transporter substrate-binding protein [Desulfobacter sp.]|nr:MAG: ABC transporter substrate-binding protein [Desulfobacter sp.]